MSVLVQALTAGSYAVRSRAVPGWRRLLAYLGKPLRLFTGNRSRQSRERGVTIEGGDGSGDRPGETDRPDQAEAVGAEGAAEPRDDDRPRGWSGRVAIAEGEDAFAFVPHAFLTPDDPRTYATVRRVLGPRATTAGEPADGPPAVRLQDVTFRRWSYEGDALSAVRRLRAAGIEWAQPVHVFFADSTTGPAGGGVSANPVYANPVYANPVYANPVYANPVYANPVYANPVYANPVYANPVYANPVYANPVYANPVYANPGGGLVDTNPMRSLVYPNPVYARQRLDDAELAERYRATGARRSQAQPTAVPEADPARSAAAFRGTEGWDDSETRDGVGRRAAGMVRVAVLDTGFDRAAKDRRDGVVTTDWVDVPDVDEVRDRDRDLDPVAGHGTFIAGLVRRLAPDAAISVKRVLSTYGDGDEDVIAGCIDDLVARANHPDIISCSFSGYALDEPYRLRASIQKANAKGIVVVASAGNDGTDRRAYPAAFEEAVAVGALGRDGAATFSNFGPWVDACAPGVDLVSWFFTYNGARPQRFGDDPDRFTGWATWSGTSFAAPIVAGALARSIADGRAATAGDAVELLITRPGLFRLPGLGTVVNVLWAPD
jgi:subtilisin family serine protease